MENTGWKWQTLDWAGWRDSTCNNENRVLEGEYVMSQFKIPYKWTAPEAIKHRTFSVKVMSVQFTQVSVWCFFIWSFTLGTLPFWRNSLFSYEQWRRGRICPERYLFTIKLFDTIDNRMTPPSNCPKPIIELMEQCWASQPAERPSFEVHFNENSKSAGSVG